MHSCPDCGAEHEAKKPQTLKERVAELEAKVAALEARPQHPYFTYTSPDWAKTTTGGTTWSADPVKVII